MNSSERVVQPPAFRTWRLLTWISLVTTQRRTNIPDSVRDSDSRVCGHSQFSSLLSWLNWESALQLIPHCSALSFPNHCWWWTLYSAADIAPLHRLAQTYSLRGGFAWTAQSNFLGFVDTITKCLNCAIKTSTSTSILTCIIISIPCSICSW